MPLDSTPNVSIKKVLHQVYRLWEVADIFIRIPLLLGEQYTQKNF
ncbi:MAG: hypothetical protein ACMUIS_08945 [bacterium]